MLVEITHHLAIQLLHNYQICFDKAHLSIYADSTCNGILEHVTAKNNSLHILPPIVACKFTKFLTLACSLKHLLIPIIYFSTFTQ